MVPQNQFAFFQPLHLDEVRARRIGQGRNGGVEVAVFLLKARQLVAQLALFVFGHRHQARRVEAGTRHGRRPLLPIGIIPFSPEPFKLRNFRPHKGLACGPPQPLTRIHPFLALATILRYP